MSAGKKILIGDILNGFKVTAEAGYHISSGGKKTRKCVFTCPSCQNDFTTQLNHISRGSLKSCGCEVNRHGLTNTLLFSE